jgi:hypothetical protein
MDNEITISNLDQVIFERLKFEADRQGTDLKTLIVQIVIRSLGLEKLSDKPTIYNDLDHLAGTWSKEEFNQFKGNVTEFSRIDDEIWK